MSLECSLSLRKFLENTIKAFFRRSFILILLPVFPDGLNEREEKNPSVSGRKTVLILTIGSFFTSLLSLYVTLANGNKEK